MNTNDEITLRDLVNILKHKQLHITIITLLSFIIMFIYLLFTQNVYFSSAVISVYPSEVRASLENKIQLEPAPRLTEDTLKILLLSQETLFQVAQKLKSSGRPMLESWNELSETELATVLRDALKANVTRPERGNTPSALTAELNVQLPDPELAAEVANIWAETAVQAINQLPRVHIEATIEAFAQQITPARDAYQKAQEALRDFRTTNNLEAWKRELASRIDRGIDLDNQIDEVSRKIEEKKLKISKTSQILESERSQLEGQPDPEKLLLQNRTLAEAQLELGKRAKSAKQTFEAAATALQEFHANTPLERWKAELSAYLQQIGADKLRLETLISERQRTQAQLNEINGLLSATPERLTLKKSLAADAELMSLIGSNLALAEGLTLDTEVINSVHTRLLEQRNSLLSKLADISEEEKALRSEINKLQTLADDLRLKISEAETEQSRLELQQQIAEGEYMRWAQLAAGYQELTGNYEISPDSDYYQTLRTTLLNDKIELATLESSLAALKRSYADNEAAISALQKRVSDAELEEARLSEALRLAKEAFLALSQKQTDLNIELASLQKSMAYVFARAYPDTEPVSPRRGLLLAVATILGLMLGVFYAFVSAALEEPPEIKQNDHE